MKKLLGILVLGLLFISVPSKADDISDFQIEGMSIGDSLLDYFTENKINKNSFKTAFPKNNEIFKNISIREKVGIYDGMKFYVKINDKKYKIYSVEGWKIFYNTSKCLKLKKNILEEIVPIITVINRRDYETEYPQYTNSKSHVTDLKTNSGYVRVWCNDFSAESDVNKKWKNSLAIVINSKEFYEYNKNEAY